MTTLDLSAPPNDQLILVARQLRDDNPTLGITKLLQLVKSQNPQWTISEKRFKKVVQSLEVPTSFDEPGLTAQTGLDPSVDIAHIAPKAKARLFDGEKGKGLVARAKILEGEVLWQEEPWIVTADSDLHPLLESKHMCSQCFTMFDQRNPPLSVPCARCNTAQFCNRLCLSKAQSSGAHLDLLCPGQNSGASGLQRFITTQHARHLDAVSKIIARWRSERDAGNEKSADIIEKRVWQGMARVDIKEKEMERKEWELTGELHQKQWEAAHALLVEALNPSPSSRHYKQFQKLLAARHARRSPPIPLSEDELHRWFSFESFLQLLGLASINQEDSGGLYLLHAHINHSCEPNLMARNLPKTFTPPPTSALPCPPPPPNPPGVRGTNKLTFVARRTIHPGDELTLPYVDFRLERTDRRQMLRELYGFWCSCPRCQREAESEKTT